MNAKHATALLILAAASAQAQVIRVVPEEFPIEAAPTALPIKPMDKPQAPKVDLSLSIKAGDLISPRLVEWAKRNGYALSWEAPEFRSEADLVLDQDFEKSLDMFLGSMRLNKVRLEAEIYANNAVRVQEVK
jgi:hypothetical protein